MKDIEKNLKNLIKERYESVSEFSRQSGIPNSTLNSMFTRGIGTATLTNVKKIASTLNISVDGLASGELIPIQQVNEKDVDVVLDVLKKDLIAKRLQLKKKSLNDNQISAIVSGIDVGLKMAKKFEDDDNEN